MKHSLLGNNFRPSFWGWTIHRLDRPCVMTHGRKQFLPQSKNEKLTAILRELFILPGRYLVIINVVADALSCHHNSGSVATLKIKGRTTLAKIAVIVHVPHCWKTSAMASHNTRNFFDWWIILLIFSEHIKLHIIVSFLFEWVHHFEHVNRLHNRFQRNTFIRRYHIMFGACASCMRATM